MRYVLKRLLHNPASEAAWLVASPITQAAISTYLLELVQVMQFNSELYLWRLLEAAGASCFFECVGNLDGTSECLSSFPETCLPGLAAWCPWSSLERKMPPQVSKFMKPLQASSSTVFSNVGFSSGFFLKKEAKTELAEGSCPRICASSLECSEGSGMPMSSCNSLTCDNSLNCSINNCNTGKAVPPQAGRFQPMTFPCAR